MHRKGFGLTMGGGGIDGACRAQSAEGRNSPTSQHGAAEERG
ncbi:hypothetical protein ACPOL_1436 [Acidisarcina polymorpha]|uniref:Uncharacterized protein n=1 Tax=Acidisarcina polymorpha TaxID=2211140 RepID=A0A2Z5FVK2_9BACT|nr:hypothetical protein ACPOL_1436 [Acidisarcina polymorpha]